MAARWKSWLDDCGRIVQITPIDDIDAALAAWAIQQKPCKLRHFCNALVPLAVAAAHSGSRLRLESCH
jgi:hypothetical protein